MSAFTEEPAAFAPAYGKRLGRQIRASPYFVVNTLNRDFVGTRGFSIVFRRESIPRVEREFPFLSPYLQRSLRADCNAFYLNPLELVRGSRVDPHIDRSLRSYVVHVDPPLAVSVLYVEVPSAMRGGELELRRGKKLIARITPTENTLVTFAGDLTHSIARLDTDGARLSVVCEQYGLTPDELERVPPYAIETRARYA